MKRFKKSIAWCLLFMAFFMSLANQTSPNAKTETGRKVAFYNPALETDEVINCFWEQREILEHNMQKDKYQYFVDMCILKLEKNIGWPSHKCTYLFGLNTVNPEKPISELIPLEEAVEFAKIFLLAGDNRQALHEAFQKTNFKRIGKTSGTSDFEPLHMFLLKEEDTVCYNTNDIKSESGYIDEIDRNKVIGVDSLFFLACNSSDDDMQGLFESGYPNADAILPGMDFDLPLYILPKEKYCSETPNPLSKTSRLRIVQSEYKKPMVFQYIDYTLRTEQISLNELIKDYGFLIRLGIFSRVYYDDAPLNKDQVLRELAKAVQFIWKGTDLHDKNQPMEADQFVKDPKIAEGLYYDLAPQSVKMLRQAKKQAKKTAMLSGVVCSASIAWNLPKIIKNISARLFGSMSQKFSDKFLAERAKLINDPIQLRGAINAMMRSGIVGLEDIIDRLSQMATGLIAISKNTSLFNRNHSSLNVFVGSPGTGKTLLAKKYGMAILGRKVPDCAMINLSIYDDGLNPMDALFNENSALVKYIIACNGNCVLILDEIDKSPYGNLILERLRNAADSGTLEVTYTAYEKRRVGKITVTVKVTKTRTIRVEGLTVIAITNEKPECWGLEPDPNIPEYQVGRTFVKRSGSMVQRFNKFYFKPFTAKEYAQMYTNALDSIKKDSMKMFGIQVIFDENLAHQLANESVHRMMGGRSVPIVLEEMAGAVTQLEGVIPPKNTWISKASNLVVNKLMKKPDKTIQKVSVAFDCDTHKFIVKLIEDKQSPADENSKASPESSSVYEEKFADEDVKAEQQFRAVDEAIPVA